MILFVSVHIPDVLLIFTTALDVTDRFKSSSHGMIHIVVAVLAITSNAIQVSEGIQPLHQIIDLIQVSK